MVAPDQIDQRDQRDQIDRGVNEQQNTPTPTHLLLGVKPPADGAIPPDQLAELLALQRVDEEELMPPPHLTDRNARALERAARQGWTVDQLHELMHIVSDPRRNVRNRTWNNILGPNWDTAHREAKEADRQAKQRQAARERGNVDPYSPEERRAMRLWMKARDAAADAEEQARLARLAAKK